MDAIFHEKQEGSLCAQHCLNSLLQGPYFSAVDLAEIARGLDEAERQRMAEGDMNSPEYLNFIQQPSSNMDDSGYFSIQVISKALKVWNLDITPFGSNDAIAATVHPEHESAFICNFKDHWLSIRKLGYQWFNLNSLLSGPELISDTYLSMFLTQLQREGYSIFVINNKLPDSEADQVLRLMPAVQTQRPTILADSNSQGQRSSAGASTSSSNIVSLGDLQSALAANKALIPGTSGSSSVSSEPAEPVDQAELRRKRQAFFDRQQQSTTSPVPETAGSQGSSQSQASNSSSNSQPLPSRKPVPKPTACSAAENYVGGGRHDEDEVEQYENDEQVTEEAMLEAAIKMSMQS